MNSIDQRMDGLFHLIETNLEIVRSMALCQHTNDWQSVRIDVEQVGIGSGILVHTANGLEVVDSHIGGLLNAFYVANQIDSELDVSDRFKAFQSRKFKHRAEFKKDDPKRLATLFIVGAKATDWLTFLRSDKCDFLFVLSELETIFPYLIGSIDEVFDLVTFIFNRTKPDVAFTSVTRGVKEYAKLRPELAVDLLGKLEADIKGRQVDVLSHLLSGLLEANEYEKGWDFVKLYLKSEDPVKIETAYYAVLMSEQDEVKGKIDWLFLSKTINKHNEAGMTSVYRVIAGIYTSNADRLINCERAFYKILESRHAEAMSMIAWNLSREKFQPRKPQYKVVFLGLSKMPFKGPSSLTWLNELLIKEAERNEDLVIEFFESWLDDGQRKHEDIRMFDWFFSQCRRKHERFNRRLLIYWMTHHHEHARQVLRPLLSMKAFQSDIPRFEKSELQILDKKQFITFLNSIIGFFISKDRISMMFVNVLRCREMNEQEAGLFGSLLYDFVLFNFPSIKDDIERQLNDFLLENQAFAKNLISMSDRYYEEITKLPVLKELTPPMRHQSKYMEVFSTVIDKSREKASEGSFMAQVRKIKLVGGGAFASGDPGKFESRTQMGNYGFSIEFPRGQKVDPVKYAWIIHLAQKNKVHEVSSS